MKRLAFALLLAISAAASSLAGATIICLVMLEIGGRAGRSLAVNEADDAARSALPPWCDTERRPVNPSSDAMRVNRDGLAPARRWATVRLLGSGREAE